MQEKFRVSFDGKLHLRILHISDIFREGSTVLKSFCYLCAVLSHDCMTYHGGQGLFFTLLTVERTWHILPNYILKLFSVISI